MSWRWLGLVVLTACSDDARLERDGMDASLDATVPSLDATPVDATQDADMCATREQTLPVMSAFHVTGDVDYGNDPPPVGGNHNVCWAPWRAYDKELADERWVHNLEHGGVIFLYNCPQGCANEVDTMRVYVSGRTQALLTPYAALPTRYAVVAWGVRLTTNCFDMPAFQQFYQEHVDNAPESIADDPPRSCN